MTFLCNTKSFRQIPFKPKDYGSINEHLQNDFNGRKSNTSPLVYYVFPCIISMYSILNQNSTIDLKIIDCLLFMLNEDTYANPKQLSLDRMKENKGMVQLNLKWTLNAHKSDVWFCC